MFLFLQGGKMTEIDHNKLTDEEVKAAAEQALNAKFQGLPRGDKSPVAKLLFGNVEVVENVFEQINDYSYTRESKTDHCNIVVTRINRHITLQCCVNVSLATGVPDTKKHPKIVDCLNQAIEEEMDISVRIPAILGDARVGIDEDIPFPKENIIPINATSANPSGTGDAEPLNFDKLELATSQISQISLINGRYVIITDHQRSNLQKSINKRYPSFNLIIGDNIDEKFMGTKFIVVPDYYLKSHYDSKKQTITCPMLTPTAMICRVPDTAPAGELRFYFPGRICISAKKCEGVVRSRDNEVVGIECYQPEFAERS